jgi:hypothetical protein
VDLYCLGVKNAFFTKFEPGEFEAKVDGLFGRDHKIAVTPAYARKLIEDCVGYASNLGLQTNLPGLGRNQDR